MSMSNTTKRVKEIRRKTRRKLSSEDKIRIVVYGLRGESSIAELCRREGINANLYYGWSKDFLNEFSVNLQCWVLMCLHSAGSFACSG